MHSFGMYGGGSVLTCGSDKNGRVELLERWEHSGRGLILIVNVYYKFLRDGLDLGYVLL